MFKTCWSLITCLSVTPKVTLVFIKGKERKISLRTLALEPLLNYHYKFRLTLIIMNHITRTLIKWPSSLLPPESTLGCWTQCNPSNVFSLYGCRVNGRCFVIGTSAAYSTKQEHPSSLSAGWRRWVGLKPIPELCLLYQARTRKREA